MKHNRENSLSCPSKAGERKGAFLARRGRLFILPILGTILAFHSAAQDNSSNPDNFTVADDTLFFTAEDWTGVGLWKSDGTEDGTVLVKSDWSGSQWQGVDGTLFFVKYDGATGYELWKSDGTAEGTVLVKDIRPGPLGAFNTDPSGPFGELTEVNGLLFFVADDGTTGGFPRFCCGRLWRSDGTPDGTVCLTDVEPSRLTPFQGALYFAGTPESPLGYTDSALWKSDGTPDGTVVVKDLCPHRANSGTLNHLTVVKDSAKETLFFTTWLPEVGEELFKSNGTPEGTVLVKDVREGINSPRYSELTDVNGTLFFVADLELWKSDGTPGGTVPVSGGWSLLGLPRGLCAVNGTLFFTQDYGPGIRLWKSDGSPGNTVGVKDIEESSIPPAVENPLAVVNGVLYLTIGFGSGTETWTSDGTTDGTVPLREALGQPETWRSGQPTAWGDRMVFSAYDDEHGWEPWVSDGTPEGTHLLKNIVPDAVGIRRGDANGDGTVDVSDVGAFLHRSSPDSPVDCDDAADANDDGILDVSDIVHVLGYLFLGAPPPDDPGPDDPGPDPTEDLLGCRIYPQPTLKMAEFVLGFEGPRAIARKGDTIQCEVVATLTTTENTTNWGAEGWSIGLRAQGVKILSIKTDGTLAAELFDGGFMISEVVDPDEGTGAVSAVVLYHRTEAFLPPAGEASIAAITLEAAIDPNQIRTARLTYVDGVQGSGQPVSNVVSLQGRCHRPALESLDVLVNDCNANETPDDSEIGAGDARDCNGNGVPDECDIREGTSADSDGNGIPDECPAALPLFVRGDANDDGIVDISDAVRILGWLFLGDAEPGCVAATNTNGDGAADLSDAVYVLTHLFLGGPEPDQPFPDCGPMPDDEALTCDTPPASCQ